MPPPRANDYRRSSSADEQVVQKPNASAAIRSYMMGTVGVILGAILGVVLGLYLRKFDLDPVVTTWINIPGELFIRALKCLVVPMVFAALTLGMADLVAIGKASIIGWRCGFLFILTTFAAALEGTFWAMILRSGFSKAEREETVQQALTVAFQCANGKYMELGANDTMYCSAETAQSADSVLNVTDINNVLNLASTGPVRTLSFSEQLQGLLKVMVPSNITRAFATGSLLSIVMFAIPFGIALAQTGQSVSGRESKRKSGFVSSDASSNFVLDFMRQINSIFLLMIKWVIKITPIAVIFLVGGALLKQTDKQFDVLQNVGFFILTVIASSITHVLIVQPILFLAITKTNPYKYMRHIIPAQLFAFGCASSVATLPISMKCVESTKEVSRSLSRFVISIGTTVNMDGAALYFPAGIIFMAETSGAAELGPIQLASLVVISVIASVGGAPIPNAGLLMIVTVWKTIYGKDLPDSYSYLVAIDWLADRCRTVVNVTGDAMLSRVIASMVGETYDDERNRNRRERARKEPELSTIDEASDSDQEKPREKRNRTPKQQKPVEQPMDTFSLV